MRHGSTLAIAFFALGALTPVALGGEPFDDRLGIRTVPIYLLMRSDVQADLKLDPNQVAEAHRAAARLYAKALTLRGKVGAGAVAARRVLDDEESHWLSSHLAPPQLDRLGQIDLQWEGAAAMLNRPVVAEYLSLTAEQQQRVAQVVAEGRSQRVQSPWTSADHVNHTRRAIAVLTDKQKDLWIHVLGPPCRFAITANAPALPPEPPADSRAGSSR
jgi:hypothetical protein